MKNRLKQLRTEKGLTQEENLMILIKKLWYQP